MEENLSITGLRSYHLFAYIIPGALLVGTLALTLAGLIPEPFKEEMLVDGAFLRGLVLSILFLALVFVGGLIVQGIGSLAESTIRGSPPSEDILTRDHLLGITIGPAVRKQIREILDPDDESEEHDDQQVWEFAHRLICLEAGADKPRQPAQFLYVSTRGALVVGCVWILIGLGHLAWGSQTPALFWLVLGFATTGVMWPLRQRYDSAVAREVILANYLSQIYTETPQDP